MVTETSRRGRWQEECVHFYVGAIGTGTSCPSLRPSKTFGWAVFRSFSGGGDAAKPLPTPALDTSYLQKKLSSGEFEIRSVKRPHKTKSRAVMPVRMVYRSQSIDSQRSSGVDDGRSSTGTRHSPGSGLKRTRYIGDGTGSLGSRKSDRCDGEDAESLRQLLIEDEKASISFGEFPDSSQSSPSHGGKS
uniref:Uncharacterized protein n=1 Tax=Anopheles coluzzii TaxID=1518534 RepID=A0A8W7P425_ANOCL